MESTAILFSSSACCVYPQHLYVDPDVDPLAEDDAWTADVGPDYGQVDIIAAAAGKEITKVHDLSKPQGVRGRNSDNGLLREVLGWEPEISLEEAMAETYRWIEGQVRNRR